MKKIIVIVLMLVLIKSEKSLAWAVSGATSVCANGTNFNNYTLTGNPANTTIMQIQWSFNTSSPGTFSNDIAPSVRVTWFDQCPTTTTLFVVWVLLKNNTTQQMYYENMPFGAALSISVKGLGQITQSPAWNLTPYKCSIAPITYCIASVCGATNYDWHIPTFWTGQTALNGSTCTCITVIPDQFSGGNISVTVVNTNGCSLSKTLSLPVTRPIEQPVFTTGSPGYCLSANPTALFCVSAVPNASSYSWSIPGGWTISGASNGTCITVDFHGIAQSGQICCSSNLNCGGTSAPKCLTVTTYAAVPALPVFTQGPSPVAVSGTVQWKAAAVPNATSYEWSFIPYCCGATSNGLQLSPLNLNCYIEGIVMGTYRVRIRAQNTCGYSGYRLAPLIVDDSHCNPCRTETDIYEASDQIIFPNPASENFTMRFTADVVENMNFEIIDMQGRMVNKDEIVSLAGENNFTVNSSTLANGIYYVILKGNSIEFRERLIIAH